MNKLKVVLGGLVAILVLATGFIGAGWADVETVVTFDLVGSLSAVTSASTFNRGSVVYVRVDNGGVTQGPAVSSRDATATDQESNQITFTVYDDGTFPDNAANDAYYWGRFTIKEGDGTGNQNGTGAGDGVLELASGETATIECELQSGGTDPGSTTIIADYSPPDHTKPEIGSFEISPNPFSPNGDGVKDSTTISYTLGDDTSTTLKVRVEIRDTNSEIVRTLVDAASQDTGVAQTVTWDGRDDDGITVAESTYTVRVIAVDGAKNSRELLSQVEVDVTPPEFGVVQITPNPFSPNADGVADTTQLSFSFSGVSNPSSGTTVVIRDSQSSLVKSFDYQEISFTNTGTDSWDASLVWDGQDQDGSVVPDGSYNYQIQIVDGAQNTSYFNGTVRVDTTFPQTAIQVYSNPSSPPTHSSPFDSSDLGASPATTGLYISDVKQDGQWQTTDASTISQVWVNIDGSLYPATKLSGATSWGGWYVYWSPSADGEHTLRVKAVDAVGNDTGASGETTTIIYDNEPPESRITSPADGTKFNLSSLTISGTASDGEEAAGVQEVEIQVTNLSTSTVIASFNSTAATDTSSGGDWSSWEYVFDPPDPGSPPVSYLIECRAVDTLYDPTSPTSSSHIQASPDSITVTYDTQNPPYHPTELKDDGISLSTGHIFGINNTLTCNQEYFSGLEEVRFEYKVEPSGSWQTIGSDSYTATPPASYVPQVSWDTTGLLTDVSYSFRAVAISGETAQTEIPSGTFSGCQIDNQAPASPYNLKDDGDSITSGHVFGRNNVFSASADVEDASLWGVRFEYRDYTTSGPWQSIGEDTSSEGNEFSVSWDTSSLDTTHTYWVRATAVDSASNETSSSAITDCSIDTLSPVFQSLSKDKDAYKNGDTITLTANLDAAGYTLSADFSQVDSEYGEGDNVEQVTDNLDSTYTIEYTISLFNTYVSGSTVVVVASDVAGNEASSSVTVILDNTSPTATIFSPSSGEIISGATTFIIEDTGKADQDVESFSLEYTPSGVSSWSTCPSQTQGEWIPGATSQITFDTTSLPDDAYDFRCKLTDTAGNVGYTEPVYSITLNGGGGNGTPPAPTNLSAQAISGARVYLTWQPSSPEDEVDHYRIYRSTQSYDYTFTQIGTLARGVTDPPSYTDGPLSDATTYYYYVTAADSQGNESGFSNQAYCTTDGTSPSFDGPIQVDKAAYKNEDRVNLTLNLDDSGYQISANFSPVDSEYGEGNNLEDFTDNLDSTYTISYQISSYNTRSDSSYTVVVVASDVAGNQVSSSVTVTLDNTAPVFTSSTLSDRSIYKNTDTISLTCFLDASGYTVTVDFSSIDTTYSSGEEEAQDIGDGSYSITYTIGSENTRSDGTYSPLVVATDAAGNQSQDAASDFSAQLTLDNTPPEFLGPTKVGRFSDDNSNGQIEEDEVDWNSSHFKNGDIVLLQVELDEAGYATSGSVSANFLPMDTQYTKGEEQPAIPGDGSFSGAGALNLLDELDNDQDGEVNNPQEASYYLIAYRISSANTRSDGSYTIQIKAVDAAGNSTSSEGSYSAVCSLDNTSPLIQQIQMVLFPSGSPRILDDTTAINEQITSLEVIFSDGEGSGVKVASSDVVLVAPDNIVIPGENVTKDEDYIKLEWSLGNLPLTDQGMYKVAASVFDEVGNRADYIGYGFIYDILAPHLVSIVPSDSSTLTAPLTTITAVVSEDTTQTTQVAGVDIENCLISLKGEDGDLIVSGGEPLDANTLKLEAEPGEYLVATNGFYFIEVKSADYANNVESQTAEFSIQMEPVSGVVKASLESGGETVYDMVGSTQATSPTCFANRRIDSVYVKVSLNQGIALDEELTDISLLKVSKVQTGNIEAEPVSGSSQINYNLGQGWAELFFYPASPFDPEKDEQAKDGLYWVKSSVVDSMGNTQQLSFFFVYDTTSPSPPQFVIESFDQAAGVATFTGTTSPESSEPQWVQVFVNGISKATTQAEDDGTFSIQAGLDSGKNSIALRAIDRAGNVGRFTDPVELTYNPQRLLSVVFRSSKILRKGAQTSPVKLIYYLSEPAEIIIRIYNLLGEIVYDWQGEVAPGSEQEWSWEGENMFGRKVNNGVYIMSIEAVSAAREERVTKLVGVLR